MMFRFGKIIESNNKSSRSDRFAEMSKQQQLIESKKQEIKAKFEERKRLEAVETTKSSDGQRTIEQKNIKDHKSLISSRMQSWKNDERWRKKPSSSSSSTHRDSSHRLFSNDGSFLEKYKKIAEELPESDKSDQSESFKRRIDPRTIIKESYSKYSYESRCDTNMPIESYNSAPKFKDFNDGIPFPPPPINLHPTSNSLNVPPQPQSLYTITSHPPPTTTRPPPTPVAAPPLPPASAPTIHTSLATVPASVSLLPAVSSSGASLQTVSLIQVPVSVPASSVILSCPLETTLVSSEPVVHLPVVHSTSITVPLQTLPLQTTVIPAQIQITSQTSMPQPSVQAVQINQSSANVILSQTTLQPPSILLSSEATAAAAAPQSPPPLLPNTNVPPPPILPAQFSQSAAMAAAVAAAAAAAVGSSLPPMHLPPPNYPTVAPPAIDPRHAESTPPPNFNRINRSLSYERSLIKLLDDLSGSSLASDSDEQRENQPLSSVAARDEKGCNEKEQQEIESVADMVAKCGDDMEEILASKYRDDDRFWYLREKQSTCYISFRNLVDEKRRELCGAGSSLDSKFESNGRDNQRDGSHLLSKVSADDDDYSDAEEADGRRKRKRKRKSRWAPEDTKIEPSPCLVPPGVGVASPLTMGAVVPVLPPIQQKKSTAVANPLISQMTRNDAALLQYALKSFGTLNLSEDDWKKAEDHYKINLLYQDMLKKRQELEKLRAAGKHKYAYDSDEDTEGGTWEHKLRHQEMVATQRWADELTERAKGRHHIGDFLPPDELERFLEKYNALKQGREPDLSDYKEFKLREDNIGFRMLQKLGWTEGQGLGSDGSGIVNPVNKAPTYATSHGLGIEKPDDVSREDDEFEAYRKRMMLAYRFRPNPLNNPRRPYY